MTPSSQGKVDQKENINIWLEQINDQSKAAVSIDCVIFGYSGDELYVLLIECNMPPFEKMKSLVGDLVRNDEHLKEGASRILAERTGLKDVYMEQVQAFGIPDRHPLGRVISVVYFTIISIHNYDLIDLDQRKPHWIAIKDIDKLAFDHKKILDTSLATLRNKIRNYPLLFNALPKNFTLIQLQQAYENILGISFDKRNFRRKLNGMPYIKFTNEMQQDVSHRPAKLYTFDFEMYEKLKEQGKALFQL